MEEVGRKEISQISAREQHSDSMSKNRERTSACIRSDGV